MARRKTRKRKRSGHHKVHEIKGQHGKKRKRKQGTRKLKSRLWKFLFACLAIVGGYVLYLDIQIRVQFEGKRWALPAHVYARPLELYVGRSLGHDRFSKELQLLGYRYSVLPDDPGTYSLKDKRFRIHTRAFEFWDGSELSRIVDIEFEKGIVTRLYDEASRTSLSLLRMDPLRIGGIYPTHGEDRILVKLQDVPILLTQTLISVEDRNFYQHHGVDLRGIARALWANLRAGGMVQGGSTLTQQLVKNFFLNNERTLWRKANEAVMAVLLELHYSKEEILEAYLNEVYLGQQGSRAIHGFGLASHFYFDKPIAKLNISEIALLVALIRGPAYYDPLRYPKRLQARRHRMLDVMAEREVVSRAQANAAKQAALGVIQDYGRGITHYPAFMDLVRRQLRRDYREDDLTSEGLQIFTTLDPMIQADVEQVLTTGINQLDGQRRLNGQLQGAAIVGSTTGGEILALVGGRNARFAGFNRALDAKRPIGSLVKPAVYLTALVKPQDYSLITRLDDNPISLRAANGDVWSPRNYDGKSHGQVPMYRALSHSYNQATVRLGMSLGVKNVVTTLQQLGIERELQPYPSLLLGAVALTPYEVTQVYQTLAAGGFYSPLRAIREVLTVDAQPLQRYPLHIKQAIDVAVVQVLNSALKEVVRSGTARSVRRLLPSGLVVAGKTGTTDDLRDSWFSGFSADHTVTVWLGTDDNRSTGLSGASGALMLWGDIMRHMNTHSLDQLTLDQVEYTFIDPKTLLQADEDCPDAVPLAFIQGSAPETPAPCAGGPISNSVDNTLRWFKELWD